MTAKAARLHRLLLLVLAVLLCSAGLSVLLTGFGAFGGGLRDRAVFDNAVSRYIGDHGSWLWPVLALAGLLLASLAVRWLLTLFRVDGVSRVDLTSRAVPGRTAVAEVAEVAGRTEVDSAALSAAVTGQVQGYREVTHATAKFRGDARAPHLALTVTATADADVTLLRQRIETEAVTDLRQALQRPDLTVGLDLQISSKTSPRSH